MNPVPSNRRIRSLMLLGAIIALLAAVLLSQRKPVQADHGPAPAGGSRAELNIGYSLLYQQASGIPKLNWILMLKRKQDRVDRITDGLLDDYRNLSRSLEDLARRYPALRLDATTMPTLLADTRKAIGVDLAKGFAPLIGEKGAKFERELLLMFYNALDEQRHLVELMVERETETGLRDFLRRTLAKLEARRREVESLLDRQAVRVGRGSDFPGGNAAC